VDNFITLWRVQDALTNGVAAAGTSDVNGAAADLTGYNCAVLLVDMGAIAATAVTSIKVQESDDDRNWTDVADSSVTIADDDDNETFIWEHTHPLKRYIRMVLDRGTANAAVNQAIWLLGKPSYGPVTQPSGVTTKLLHK